MYKFFNLKVGRVKKSLFVSLGGNLFANAINFLSTPIITRVFTPSQVGTLSVFNNSLNMMALFSTLNLDLAILNEEDEEVIEGIISFVLFFSILVSLVFLGLSAFNLFPATKNFQAFLAITNLFMALWKVFRAINNKRGDFRTIAYAKIFEAFVVAGISICLGLISFGEEALLLGKMIGIFLAALYLCMKVRKKIFLIKKLKKTSITQSLHKHKFYPIFSVPSLFLFQLTQLLPLLTITNLYGSSEAGYYGLTQRVLAVPIGLIGTAFVDVFRREARKKKVEQGEFSNFFLKTLCILLVFSLAMIVTLFPFGEELFTFVFGLKWKISGIYAKYLVLLYAMRLVSSTLSYSLFISEELKINFWLQLLGALGVVMISYFAKSESYEALTFIKLLSLWGAFHGLVVIYISYQVSR